MNNQMIQLSLKDTFRFSCNKSVPCFNACCKDLNQNLTPYDIIRLKNHLGLPSGDFLERYTLQHMGPESGLPIITLKFESSHGLRCPFVTPSGCRVYEDRPSSCRSYPLALAASRSRATGEIVERYLLMKEPHCLGFEQDRAQIVEEWLEGQGIPIYNRLNNLLLEILSLKNRRIPGLLDIRAGRLFHLACYDLDNFRNHIFEKGLLDDRNLDSATLDAIENDDVALLKLGVEWIKQELFG